MVIQERGPIEIVTVKQTCLIIDYEWRLGLLLLPFSRLELVAWDISSGSLSTQSFLRKLFTLKKGLGLITWEEDGFRIEGALRIGWLVVVVCFLSSTPLRLRAEDSLSVVYYVHLVPRVFKVVLSRWHKIVAHSIIIQREIDGALVTF